MKTLEKWKRNQIFEAVRTAGFNPTDFEWDDAGDDACLRHGSSAAYFVFGGNASKYVVNYVAGDGPEWKLDKYSWEALMASVGLWLADVKRDTEMPDLWGELLQQTERLSVADAALENTPFTPDERIEIGRRLGEFREYATATHAFSETQLADLDAKLDYLIGATGHLGRKDWLFACIGAVFAYLLAAALPPDTARQIFEALMAGIAQVFGHTLYLAGG